MPTPDRDPSPATPKTDKAGEVSEVSVARYEGYGVTLGCGEVGCTSMHDEPAPLSDDPAEPAAASVQEPRLWSVLADTGGGIWLRIGEDADGVGIWLDTGQSGPRYSRYADLSVDCVLALGLAEPLRPAR